MEDFLHGAEVGGVSEVDGAGVGTTALIAMSEFGAGDFADGVAEIVGVIAGYTCVFLLVPPEDDDAALSISTRRHDDRNDAAQEVIALADVGRIAGETRETIGECSMHVVVLVRRDPVVIGDAVAGEVNTQLLKRRVIFRKRIRGRPVVTVVVVCKDDLRNVLGSVVVLASRIGVV